MCGIAGFVGGDWSSLGPVRETLLQMNDCMRHRGPDQSAWWVDEESRAALAFNRLAIIDLSPAGHQPMHSKSGRYVITFNGEIYNHVELRELLSLGAERQWDGHSDTEVLLAAIEAWGIAKTLERCTGMFAFALWDRESRSLTLARDRLGEKPLYYGHQQGRGLFLFGSELKAIAQHPQFRAEVDRQALTLLLRYNYIPAPFSIYKGIRKLVPGQYLIVKEGLEPELHEYWSGARVARTGAADPLRIADDAAVSLLENTLERAIGRQMVADVPLGAFLSGGIDSSAVVALMQKQSSRPVKTFTIGFEEREYNEAEDAKAVAKHLGTDHHELYVTAGEAQSVIPRLPHIYDEPFADSSQIPTYLVSEMAKSQVTVALSGDGGDELFGGYNRYLLTKKLWNRLSLVPRPVRAAAARAITAIPPSIWDSWAGWGRAGQVRKLNRAGDKLHKGAPLLGSRSSADLYGGMLSLWYDPASVVIDGVEPPSIATGYTPNVRGLGDIERMMALDMLGYLPDDILTKLDRAAMAVSLETRVPFLDHKVTELAWALPLHLKIRDGQTKWILRQLLYRHVPRDLVERPKMGFGVPIGEWLRGPLRDWAESLLGEERLRNEGYFRPEPIRRLWGAHLSGATNGEYRLWGVLMFQCWLEAHTHGRSSVSSRAVALAG